MSVRRIVFKSWLGLIVPAQAGRGAMRRARGLAVMGALGLALAGPAYAQRSGIPVPLPVVDSNSAAFQGVVAVTPGTPTAALRSIGFVITTAGPVTLTLADGSTITLALSASPSLQTLPFAVTSVALGSGTAGQFWNLK